MFFPEASRVLSLSTTLLLPGSLCCLWLHQSWQQFPHLLCLMCVGGRYECMCMCVDVQIWGPEEGVTCPPPSLFTYSFDIRVCP